MGRLKAVQICINEWTGIIDDYSTDEWTGIIDDYSTDEGTGIIDDYSTDEWTGIIDDYSTCATLSCGCLLFNLHIIHQ